MMSISRSEGVNVAVSGNYLPDKYPTGKLWRGREGEKEGVVARKIRLAFGSIACIWAESDSWILRVEGEGSLNEWSAREREDARTSARVLAEGWVQAQGQEKGEKGPKGCR